MKNVCLHKKINIMILLHAVLRAVKFTETANRTVVARGGGVGGMGWCCLMSIEFQVCKMEGVLEMGCTPI